MAAVTLIPAYGRKYATVEALLKDWQEGKDFRIGSGGPYCSVRDLDQLKRMFWACDLVLYDRHAGLNHTVAFGLGV